MANVWHLRHWVLFTALGIGTRGGSPPGVVPERPSGKPATRILTCECHGTVPRIDFEEIRHLTCGRDPLESILPAPTRRNHPRNKTRDTCPIETEVVQHDGYRCTLPDARSYECAHLLSPPANMLRLKKGALERE